MSRPDTLDPRLGAAVELLGHCGAAEFQLRYCEEEQPVVWVAAARWHDHWSCAGGMGPAEAIYRLCTDVIDGGTCTHCGRPTAFSEGYELLPAMLPAEVCWYRWDAQLALFRRSCEDN